jgi:hypothetical protein
MRKTRRPARKVSRSRVRSKSVARKATRSKPSKSAPKAPPKARPQKQAPAKMKEIVINNRRVTISEDGGQVQITIDGVPINMTFKTSQGTYNTHFFPSHSFETPEEMAKILVETEGKLWLLKKEDSQGGMGGMPMPAGKP